LIFAIRGVRVTVHVAARFTDKDVLASRADHFLVGAVDPLMQVGLARLERLPTRFAHQGTFAETALNHSSQFSVFSFQCSEKLVAVF
jgi:hypothetical protein